MPIQSGTIEGNLMDGLVNCTACSSPCASCRADKDSCTSCVSGFSLASDICLSDFNYKVSVVLQVTLAEFENNFLSFLKKIAVAAGVSVNNIVINSITQGSVVVDMSVTSFTPAGSTSAVDNENSLNSLIDSGTISNMPVASSALTAQGGWLQQLWW